MIGSESKLNSVQFTFVAALPKKVSVLNIKNFSKSKQKSIFYDCTAKLEEKHSRYNQEE
jgi:hypothetical protein